MTRDKAQLRRETRKLLERIDRLVTRTEAGEVTDQEFGHWATHFKAKATEFKAKTTEPKAESGALDAPSTDALLAEISDHLDVCA